MATLVVYVSTAFKEAIANDDEQGIEECRADMYGNQHLRAAVNKLLNAEEEEYMRDYMAKKSETRNVNAEEKAAKNQAYAKAFAEKQKQIKNTEV
jgi:hypothetical protein